MKRIVNSISLCVVVGLLAWPAAVLADKPVVTVSTAEELYLAVNDPANMNVVVQLMGNTTYTLEEDSYPNGGRLVLQPGMDLVGENEYDDLDGDGVWDPLDGSTPTPSSDFVVPGTETIIDGSGIDPDGDKGDLIVVGHDNQVKNLTIKNMPYGGYALIGSSADGYSQVGWKLRVIDCLLENDSGIGLAEMGVDCVNRGSELDGANTKCTLTGNIVRNLPNIGGSAPDGFRIRNDGSNNAKIHVTLRGNRAYSIPGRPNPPAEPKEGHGLALYGTYFSGGNNNDVKAVSIGNVFSDCGVGIVVFGGFPLFTISNGNCVRVTSNNDQVTNNYTQGGVVILGAFPILGVANENEALVKMLGTSFVSNNGQPENMGQPEGFPVPIRLDLIAAGAAKFTNTEEALDNKASLLLRGATSDNGAPSFIIIISDPENDMSLIGSETAVERANEGVDLIFF